MQSFRPISHAERLYFLENYIAKPECMKDEPCPFWTAYLSGEDGRLLEQALILFLQEHETIAKRYLETLRHQGSGLLPCSKQLLFATLRIQYGEQTFLADLVLPGLDTIQTTYLSSSFHVWSICGKEGSEDIFLELVNPEGHHSFLPKGMIEDAEVPIRTRSALAETWLLKLGIPVERLL